MPSQRNNGMRKGLVRHGNQWRFKVRQNGVQTWVFLDPQFDDATFQQALQEKNRLLGLEPSERVTTGRGVKVGDYFDRWVEEEPDLADSTREQYRSQFRNHLKPLRDKKMAELTEAHIRSVLTAMRRDGLSKNTQRNALVPLRKMFESAVARRDAGVGVTPFARLEKKQLPKAKVKTEYLMLSAPQQLELVRVGGLRWGALIALALWAGLRISEALALAWEDIDFNNRVIHVRHQLSRTPPYTRVPKLKMATEDDPKQRDVDMSDMLAAALRKLRGDRIVLPAQLLFETESGLPTSRRNASRAWENARKKAGLDEVVLEKGKPLTFHGLRHNFASLLITRNGEVDLEHIASQLGHSLDVLLRIYAHEFKHARRNENMVRDTVDGFLAEANG